MSKIKQYLYIFFGITMVAYAISCCYIPNKIVGGGVTGIGTILYHTFNISPGISNAVINILLLLLGYKILGRNFVFKTMVSVLLLSGITEMFVYLPPLTDNALLATIFGSVLYGFGIGITLVCGSSSGGTDIVGRLLQYKMPHLPIGKLLLIVDGVIIFVSLVVFKNIELSLYGVIALFVATYSIDKLIKILNISKLAFIVTEKGDDIAQKLVSTSPRGVTIIDAVGAYTNTSRKMLICALKSNETPEFQRKILELDPDAFLIFSESQQIVGNGFYVYK